MSSIFSWFFEKLKQKSWCYRNWRTECNLECFSSPSIAGNVPELCSAFRRWDVMYMGGSSVWSKGQLVIERNLWWTSQVVIVVTVDMAHNLCIGYLDWLAEIPDQPWSTWNTWNLLEGWDWCEVTKDWNFVNSAPHCGGVFNICELLTAQMSGNTLVGQLTGEALCKNGYDCGIYFSFELCGIEHETTKDVLSIRG
jgi:hypothetical protein